MADLKITYTENDSAIFRKELTDWLGHTITRSIRTRRRGCVNSSNVGSSPPATSTRDQSKTFRPTISKAIHRCTVSRGLASGRTHCDKRDGKIPEGFGQDLVHAKVSPCQVDTGDLKIPVISGLNSYVSLASVVLQKSLENRSRLRLTGSVSCEVIWKDWDTPWGVCLSKPRARERIISVTDTGLLQIAFWPTPTSSDHKSRSASKATLERNARPLREIIFALWSTIRATDGAKGGPNMSFGAGGSPLPSQISKIGSTFNAPTENGVGSLHPQFAGWELGLPPEYINCAPLETPSIRARQRSS